eukprot:63867-Rhodomonas_salina.1
MSWGAWFLNAVLDRWQAIGNLRAALKARGARSGGLAVVSICARRWRGADVGVGAARGRGVGADGPEGEGGRVAAHADGGAERAPDLQRRRGQPREC